MPLALTLPHERNEELFSAIFGRGRGVPAHLLLPVDPISQTSVIDEQHARLIRTFASKRWAILESNDGGEWFSRGRRFTTQPSSVSHWHSFLSCGRVPHREVIAARLDNQVLLAFDESNARAGQVQQIVDICEKAGIEVLFDTKDKLLAVERAVVRQENVYF